MRPRRRWHGAKPIKETISAKRSAPRVIRLAPRGRKFPIAPHQQGISAPQGL